MINILYSEILKLKRSFFLLIMLVGGLAIPLILFLGWLFQGQIVEWERYTPNSEIMMFILMCPILFSLVVSYIFSREFNDKTANTLYSYPTHRIKIFIGKLLVAFLIITTVYVIHFIGLFLGGIILKHEPLTKEILYIHFKISMYSMLLQFSLTPIVIFIANLSRNIIVPILYGVVIAISNIFLFESKKIKYSPFIMPVIPKLNYMNYHNFIDSRTIIMAILTFAISFTICIIYYLKTDIS